MEENEDKRWAPWNKPTSQPDNGDIRKMLVIAIKMSLHFVMENHIYVFDHEIRKQAQGGPIGLELTGVIAQLFMMWWDRQFIRKMEERQVNIILYKRYVDDINIVMTQVDNDQIGTEIAGEENSNDKMSAILVQAVGNTIHRSISIEVDYPSKHDDGKLPILNLKVWIGDNQEVGNGGERRKIIMHE